MSMVMSSIPKRSIHLTSDDIKAIIGTLNLLHMSPLLQQPQTAWDFYMMGEPEPMHNYVANAYY